MKIKEGKKLIKPFLDKCEGGKEPYLVVLFSKEDDHFHGAHNFMDCMDAMIVIKNLVKEFKIDKVLLSTAI